MNKVSIAFPRRGFGPALTAVPVATLLALGGCQTSQGTEGTPTLMSAPQSTQGPGERVIERDVEAPEVFQVQENGLWDGRPSLGGVWVAHPTAQDPERVLIRNSETGESVIGALFRRERDNPGPRFQVSSEAAGALGILAGAPTEIEVTALRLQRVEMEIDPAPQPETATAATETLAIAPVATADAGTSAGSQSGAAAPEGAPEGQVQITSVAAPEPERRSFLSRLFGRDEPEAAPADAPIAQSALDAPAAAAPSAPVAAVEPEPRRRSFLDRLRGRDPEPQTADVALPELGDAQDAAATAPLHATGTAPLPAQVTQPAPRIDRPYVQIGIFSVEQNAINARASMLAAGLNSEIRRGAAGDNQFWRVVVGPAATTSERAAFLSRVREMGFADAYAVVR
ncbi:SPOR domain-containing protein [Rhodobacter sp. NTK016B]|uniref:SPOR domain-containing protein n=1 Tax=Rhodobacter sp. NTK016B TaxID=2759676 RepID=UPI001A907EDB|nr:SPOR domain-containing protein [Rhodobacter sp. NTK016B]MBN8294229.1 SPOR domain-containing protein [Rhodobacter sp. NTK016B]